MNQIFSIISRCVISGVLIGVLGGCQQKQPNPVPTQITKSTPCAGLVAGGFPQYATPQVNDWFVCHEGYASEYNPRSKTPVWVVEHLTAANLKDHKATRQEDFRPDPDISPKSEANLEDYSHSGFDRGHMAPAEDFRGNIRQMSQSFFLSNLVPQNPDNNRGIWARLEKNVRDWAFQRGDLYLITGPVFLNNTPQGWIGNHLTPVAVPTHLYKIIYDAKRKEALGFLIPNSSVPMSGLSGYGARISYIESITGLNFFPNLPAADRQQIENGQPSNDWLIR